MINSIKHLPYLLIILLLIGEITMANGQNKPPILNNLDQEALNPALPSTQAPPPPPRGVRPPAPGQDAQADLITPNLQQYFLQNALKAVQTAKSAKQFFIPGKVWTRRAPAGEIEVKGSIIYQGIVIDAIKFNPVDFSILPVGYNPQAFNVNVTVDAIKRKLREIISHIEVLNGAEYRGPENVWVVPLSFQGMIVAHIKVYYDGIHVVPEYPLQQEMKAYGQ